MCGSCMRASRSKPQEARQVGMIVKGPPASWQNGKGAGLSATRHGRMTSPVQPPAGGSVFMLCIPYSFRVFSVICCGCACDIRCDFLLKCCGSCGARPPMRVEYTCPCPTRWGLPKPGRTVMRMMLTIAAILAMCVAFPAAAKKRGASDQPAGTGSTCSGLRALCLSRTDCGERCYMQPMVCNAQWDNCMKSGFWSGALMSRPAERR